MTALADVPRMSVAEAHARLTSPGAPFEIKEIQIRGVTTRIWTNVPATLRELFINARGFGLREFLVYEDERVTYEAFARASALLARRLIADGVRKGDRIAIAMPNLPEWPVAFWAGILAGAIVTPLNAWGTGRELEFALADSGAKIAIVDQRRLERLADHIGACPALERIYVSRGEGPSIGPGAISLESVIGNSPDWAALEAVQLPDVAFHPEDEALILYTSGTTGKPKGALASHRNMTTNVGTSGIMVAREYLRSGRTPPAAIPQRVQLLVIPLFHATGLSATMGTGMNAGAKLVMMPRWDTEQAMRLIQREKVTHAGGVPTIISQLLEHPARREYDLSSLQGAIYGGAPSPPELAGRVIREFPGCVPTTGWGMTETMATFTSHMARDYLEHSDSAGVAAPVGEMKVMDSDGGRELPAGEVGELWVKGPQIVIGYWNNPQATAAAFADGWLRTGDLARIDDEGFLYIADRAKDMLIRGGENIYCVEVENALYEWPDVIDAAVVGIPHPTLGEEAAAVVHLRPGAAADEAALQAFVRQRLAGFKVPVRIEFLSDPLPRNANGKITKPPLRRLFAGDATGDGGSGREGR